MSRKIVLDVEVNGLGKIEQGMDQLEQNLKGVQSGFKDVTKAQQQFAEAGSQVSNQMSDNLKKAAQNASSVNEAMGNAATQGAQNLKTQLREMTLELQNLEPGSQRFTELTIKAGQLRDQIADTNAVINATAGTGVENLAKGLSGVGKIGLNAFQGIMGAQAVMGVESQKLQEMMVKLQGVMAMTQALEALGGLGDQITNLKTSFGAFFTSAKAGLTGIRGAVIGTGIGALVVAVGLLVAYWDDILALVGGVSAEQEKAVQTAKENVGVAEEQVKQFQNQENSLRLQGKSEKEILQLRVKRIDAVIQEQETYIVAMEQKAKLELEAAKRNQEITKMLIRIGLESAAFGIRMLAAPIDAVIETANAVAKILGFNEIVGTNLNELISEGLEVAADYGSKFFFDPAEVEKKNKDLIKQEKDKLDKLKSDRDGLLLEIKKIEEQEVKNSIAAAKEREEKLKELREQSLQLIKQMEERRVAASQTQADLELEKLEGTERQKAEIERNFQKERQAMIDASIQQEVESLDEKFINGKIKEEEYLEELRKLRQDDSKLNEEERKLLLTKEKIKNDSLLKIDEEVNQKKKEELEKYNKWKNSKETDEFEKARITARDNYNTDIDVLKEFLKNKTITQEQYDEEVKQRAEKLNEDLADIDKRYRDKDLDRLKGAFSTIGQAFQNLREGAAGLFGDIASSLSGGLSQLMDIGKMKFDEFGTQLQNTAQKVNAYAQAIGGMLQSVLGAVSEEQKQRLEENLSNVEETYDSEIKALEEQKKQGLITEEQFAQQKYQTDLKRFNAEEALRKKAFEQEKGMKIASAIISGLQGAVAAFAGAMQLGPIAGPLVGGILAGVVAAMTAVNVAQISATQYKGGTPPSAPSIAGGVEGAGSQVSGAMQAPQVSQTTLFGQAMTGGNQGSQNQEMGQRQQPMRAYVLETDITTSQNTISTYEQRAEIG